MADENVKKLVVNSSATSNVIPEVAETEIEDPFDDVKKEMRARYELLPEELKNTIMDEGYQMKLFNIAKAQKLTYEELGILEMETTMILLGMIVPENYRDELQVQLKKNDAEIDAIVKEVNSQVFDPLRASLKKIYDVKRESADFLPQAQELEEKNKAILTPQSSSPVLSKEDTSVLGKAGVIISETPQIKTTELPPLNRNELLASIENPVKSQPINIVSNKLTEDKPIMQPKMTDYSIAKPAPASSTPNVDPYREKI